MTVQPHPSRRREPLDGSTPPCTVYPRPDAIRRSGGRNLLPSAHVRAFIRYCDTTPFSAATARKQAVAPISASVAQYTVHSTLQYTAVYRGVKA